MAWENLQSIVLNGNTVNLSILDTTGINWVANASNQQFNENTSASADGSTASGIFKLTSSSDVISHNNETYDLGNEYYFQFGYYGNPYQQCSILLKKGTTTYGYATNRGTNKYPILFGIIVNHELQMAKFWGYNDNALNNNHSLSAQWVTTGSYDDFCTLLYNVVMANQPVLYEWSSVPAISGKNGILRLSEIKDEFIGDGSAVSGANLNTIARIAPGSRISTLAGDLGNNQQATIIYSGDGYRMDIERITQAYPVPGQPTLNISAATLKFYLLSTTGGVENLIYSYTVQFGVAVGEGSGEAVPSYLGFIIDDENEVAALNIISVGDTTVDYCNPGTGMTSEQMHLLWIWLKAGNPEEDEDPLDSFEDNEGDGGGDLITRPNNPIPEPGVSGLSAYDSGFVSQWLIGKTELKSLSDFLWSANFVENVQKFFNDPRQIIQGIVISDVLPLDYNTTPSEIKAGGISTGINGNKLNKQFERYEMGKLTINKRLKDNTDKGGIYFDYSPFTSLKLYLPYCGEHTLNPDDIIGKTLKLSYTVDHLSGVCCAHLTIVGSEDECHYNFTGQMGVQIPLSAEDYGGFYRAILSAGAAVGGALATTAAGGMTAPMAIGSAANAISNIANMGRDVSYTSGGGSISGELSSEYPYITIEEPDPFMATNQKHYTGYPCFSTYKLKNMIGYTKIMAIHLDGLSCTESEREAIRAQLSSGVIIQTGDELPTPSSGDELYKIMLLTNLSDVDTIGKKFAKGANDEVAYIEIKSDLIYNQNFTRVGLLVDEFNAGVNYVYIPAFGRCYYIDSITAESGSMCRLDLVCDASESFWSELKECDALIETTQQKAKAKLLVNNNTWFMPQKKNIKTLTFKDELGNDMHFSRKPVSDGGKQCFLITIAGG